jgi:hypothetical protein
MNIQRDRASKKLQSEFNELVFNMHHTLKSILTDYEFWFILIAAFGFAADAAAEGNLTVFRMITIVAMTALVITHVYRKIKLQKEKKVPFLVVVGKSDSQYRDTLNQVEAALRWHRLNVSALEKTFGLLHEDWIYHRESYLPTDPQSWKETILRIERKFWRLAERLPGRKVYHIFMNGPSTLSLALGATMGSRNEFTFYHYMPGTGSNPYHPLIDFKVAEVSVGPHILKSRVKELEFIRVSGVENIDKNKNSEALVAIYVAGHNPISDVSKRSKETGIPMVTIESRYEGTIPLEVDWIRISSEISSVLLNIAGNESIDRLHLFLSMPLALAFCVGTALGKFVRATVYNYFPNPGKYFEVFKLEEL